MAEYKFDLDKLSIGDLVLLSGGNLEIDKLFLIVDKACNIDLLQESFGDLVHIMGGFQKEIARRSDDIAIALGSLRWNLNDTEGS